MSWAPWRRGHDPRPPQHGFGGTLLPRALAVGRAGEERTPPARRSFAQRRRDNQAVPEGEERPKVRGSVRPGRYERVRGRRFRRRPGASEPHGLLHRRPGSARQAHPALRAVSGEVDGTPRLPETDDREGIRRALGDLLEAFGAGRFTTVPTSQPL